jgi:uncharacterized membrane protein
LIGAGSREGGTSKHTNYNENNNNNNSKLLRHSTGETQQHSNKQNNPESLGIIYYISYMWNNCFNFCFFIIVNLKIWRKKIIVVMESYRVRWSKQRIKTKLFVKIETRIGSSQFHEQTTIVLRNKRYSEVIGNFPLDNNNMGSV